MMSSQEEHSILFIQKIDEDGSSFRTWLDFTSVKLATDAVIKIYEDDLKALNPNSRKLNYSLQDLCM
jgi:hypothetical protein